MERDREIDGLPSKVVGRRREGASTLDAAQTLQQTFRDLRGGVGLAPPGLYRFPTFEEAQEWMSSQTSRRSVLIRTKMTIRPSDAADRAWLESLRKGGSQ